MSTLYLMHLVFFEELLSFYMVTPITGG